MFRRQLPPGKIAQDVPLDPGVQAAVSVEPVRGPWDGYLFVPDKARLGICSSGGGIRSASFSLGGLQVLREIGVLHQAEYLSCVSGGGYITIAHSIMTSETLRRRSPETMPKKDADLRYFGSHKPWGAGSPEEEHLRDHLTYLAPGFLGKAWAFLNLLYGAVRLLLPFTAGVYVAGFAVGFALHRWLGTSLNWNLNGQLECVGEACVTWSDVAPFFVVSLGFLALAAVFMNVRNIGQKRHWSGWSMLRYQLLAFAAIAISLVLAFILVILPLMLIWLHQHGDEINPVALVASYGTLASLVAVVTFVVKHYRATWFHLVLKVFMILSAPLIVLVPFVGFTYWNAQSGQTDALAVRLWILFGAGILLAFFMFVANEVTSIAHLFYRERLATAFVGYRSLEKDRLLYSQPPWSAALLMSDLESREGAHQPDTFPNSRMPKLVVCCAVNLSSGIPVGRGAASFTIDQDLLVGGPTTGYQRVEWLQDRAKEASTLPTFMAVSGAAVSPSMGKMTRPALRFVMALFNLRLGIWIPNPYLDEPWWPWKGSIPDPPPPPPTGARIPEGIARRYKRPGAWHILKEAVGANKLTSRNIYVTDGGHWENLGLVELLRRGCGRIVCIDGSGGDAVSFGTLSEAIALARSDLGVEITIDLDDLKPFPDEDDQGRTSKDQSSRDARKLAKRQSRRGFAVGEIHFPDMETVGTLVYVRAVVPRSAPQDVLSYALKDRRFPNTSTGNQLFSDAKFEAYRALGRHNVHEALEHLLPWVPPDEDSS